jgi:hypothetical protein
MDVEAAPADRNLKAIAEVGRLFKAERVEAVV